MTDCPKCEHWEMTIQKHKDEHEPLRKFLGKLYDMEITVTKSQHVAASFVVGMVAIAVLAALVVFCYSPVKILVQSVLNKRTDCEDRLSEVGSSQGERPSTSTSGV